MGGKKKGLKKYWDYIETSLIVYVVYSLITLVLPLTELIGTVASSIISIVITIYVFGLIGHHVAREKKADVTPGKTGAWGGVLMGLFSAVIGILAFYLFPERIAEALEAAAAQGVDIGTSMTFIQIGIYLNLVILPLIYALIAALFSWLGYSIFKKKK